MEAAIEAWPILAAHLYIRGSAGGQVQLHRCGQTIGEITLHYLSRIQVLVDVTKSHLGIQKLQVMVNRIGCSRSRRLEGGPVAGVVLSPRLHSAYNR